MIDDIPHGFRESGAIEIREKLRTLSGGYILDVGTQEGDFITTLMKTLGEYKSFVGIDISADALKKAREQHKNAPVNLVEMNAETMSFPDNQFDTVCISYSIHHLENIDTVLAEMYRVLKPGGNFIVQELYSDGEQTAAQQLDRAIHNLNVKIDTILGIPHFEALTRQELRDSVNKIGLKIVEIYESSWPVKCLFCKDARKCEDPLRKENVDYVIKDIEADISRILDYPPYEELREEGESIKERVKVSGRAEAPVMYFFGKK